MTRCNLTQDWTAFDPKAYLREYYADLGSENVALLRFLDETFRSGPRGGRLLDFGGGPTIYPLISAARYVDEIHFSDYLESNLEEVRKWLAADPEAFDWTAFVGLALALEAGRPCGAEEVAARQSLIRERVTRVMRCDASLSRPIQGTDAAYDVVLSNFCAESATSDRSAWQGYVANITSLLAPGGRLILSALKGATSYSVGSVSFPAVDLSEDDVIELLEDCGFPRKTIELRTVKADRPTRDYQGLMLVVADKAPCGPTSAR